MADPFYTPNRRPPPRDARSAEPRWTLIKGVARMACVLRDHGDLGVEIQLLRDGAFLYGRRFDTRELALQFAAVEQQALVADGWTSDLVP